MKNIKFLYPIIMLCLFSFSVLAQNKEEDKILTVVEQNAEYPGGMNKMMKYLADNIQYPDKAKEEGIQGRVMLSFVVDANGSISNIKIIKDIGYGCGDEAVRVVKNMPKWKPAKQKGKNVRQQFNLPVMFHLPNK